MLVVSDTSPLRALQAIQCVPLLERAYGSVLLPPAVAIELAVSVPNLGEFHVADFPFLVVRAPLDQNRVKRLNEQLNAGEAEAIALAIEVHAETVLVDEAPARRMAAQLGLKTTGVLALLVKAKNNGWVERVGPLIDELDVRISFRISEQLRRRILEDAGEI